MDNDIKIFNYFLDVLLTFSSFFFIGSLFFFPIVFGHYGSYDFVCYLSGRWREIYLADQIVGSLSALGLPLFVIPFLFIGSLGVALFCWMIRVIDVNAIQGNKKHRLLLIRGSRILLTITSILGFIGVFYFRKYFLPSVTLDLNLKFTGGFYIALILFPLYSIVGLWGSLTVPSYAKIRESLSTLYVYAEQIVHDERISDFEDLFLEEFRANINRGDVILLFGHVVNEILLANEMTNSFEDMALPFSTMFPDSIPDIQEELEDLKGKKRKAFAEKLVQAIITLSIIDDS
ncbi:MAG: hypothetical protein ACTSSH_02220 [Candidatus Heimdallarchaeota archaeon]